MKLARVLRMEELILILLEGASMKIEIYDHKKFGELSNNNYSKIYLRH